MSRRGENIYHRSDGRWEARIPCEPTPDGVKKYRSIYAHSYAEVKEKMEREKQKKREPDALPELRMDEVFRRWLRDMRPQWKDSTYSCYMQIAEKHLFPDLGSVPVSEMNAARLQEFARKKQEGGHPLSDSYLHDLTRMVAQALKHLQTRYGYKLDVQLPVYRVRRRKVRPMPTRASIQVLFRYLLDHLEDDTCLGILLCCHTGLRIGELCALRWEDIELEDGVVHVRRTLQRIKAYENGKSVSKVVLSTPKSAQSLRDIPLPGGMTAILRKYAKRGECYLISGKNAPYAEPRTLQYRFQSVLRECGLEYFNFHMLRHIFATRCVVLGFDTNSVSELLGHANVQITLNAYVHPSAERKRELMSLFYL